MALITEKVMKSSEKCKECVLQQMREYLAEKKLLAGRGVLDKDTAEIFYEGSERLADLLLRLGCNLCPSREEFIKVYGITPHDYFLRHGVANKDLA